MRKQIDPNTQKSVYPNGKCIFLRSCFALAGPAIYSYIPKTKKTIVIESVIKNNMFHKT